MPVPVITLLTTIKLASRQRMLTINHMMPPTARINGPSGYYPRLLTAVPMIRIADAVHLRYQFKSLMLLEYQLIGCWHTLVLQLLRACSCSLHRRWPVFLAALDQTFD